MDDPQAKPSKLRRRALLAAPVVALLAIAAAVLLWPAQPKTAPARTIVPAAATPPPPLAWEPPPPKRASRPKRKPKPRPKPEKREPRPGKIRIDRNAARPVAVRVRSAGISAPIIALGLQPNGKIEVPEDPSQAGWRENGPEPGERGAAFITAHINMRSQPGAFLNLDRVSRGDEIDVRRKDGTTATFVAERTEQVDKDSFPTQRVYGKTRLPTLRLVTCGGSFDSRSGHYTDNLIVYATRQPS